MFRAFLNPTMKRLTRRPVSDEEKAHLLTHDEDPDIQVFLSVTTVTPLYQREAARPQEQPKPQPQPQPEESQLQDQQDKDIEQDKDVEAELVLELEVEPEPELEPEALESGAQGDNEQSDNESGPVPSTPDHTSEVQTCPAGDDPAQLKALAGRQQIAKLLTRLGDGAEGDGEANQIVMELLGSRDENPTSAIERITEQLLGVLREQTLIEAGIASGNERYRCFKCVLQNYAKIYAARRFMEQLPQLGQNAEVQEEHEDLVLFARVVAEDVLQIPELLRQLWSSLEKMEFFNEDTAFTAYLEARRHPQARILCELMLTRISRVFLCIVSSTFFLEFTEHELTHILRNCYLSVNSEIEIFLSVLLWLEHNWFERGDCAERILAEVRFALMPTWYLSTLDRANRCRHFSRVIQISGVQRMISQGLDDAVILKSKPGSSGAAGGPCHLETRGEVQLERDWIADTECRHHHKRHCERFVYPTYDTFKEYLARIICCTPNYWRTFRPAQEVYRSDFRCCSSPHFN
ncbi:uncharacterized protein LOC128265065 [Drosophila gunungcola]|uniref:BACK domain-containing protein n=1 Tax=Drosophila gunungcola TaxID=103775 RepID=A0A9Q0BIM0_9MUSC|nr:uncharacterized protein LOC128265065 [Drosophila gunungcola]KAI8033902.1 hypothetical protein M5D96_013357 [Drosophila gunungcola]